MKTIKSVMVAVFAMTAVFTVKADNDNPISFNQLPQLTQQFMHQYFSEKDVSFAKMERDLFSMSYEVFLVDGTKVEFKKDGEWGKVDCQKKEVPAGIVPQEILKYIKEKHPNQFILEIEREKKYYEIQLNNGIEIKFNKQFIVIKYDD